MMRDDLENELRGLKLMHLTESEMAAYVDDELDRIGRDRAEAHLKQCFICERRVELMREESAALTNRMITAEEEEFVDRLIERAGGTAIPATGEPPLRERLAEYLRQMIANWQVSFQVVRHSDEGEELWRWQSEDGRLVARATMEENADMVVYISSTEMGLQGTILRFSLKQFNKKLTLRPVSESEVAAEVAIPWPYRTEGVKDITIEIL